MAMATAVAVLAIAIPALAASPSPSEVPESSVAPTASVAPSVVATATTSTAPASATPGASATPNKPANDDKSQKPVKVPETIVSLKGTVHKTVDGKGRPTFTMTVDGKTWNLSAGPPWFWSDNDPLSAFAGKSVTVAGTTCQGHSEVDVKSVDGKALRAPGKPPWAGGPWVVGPTHPGWKDWMADGKPGMGHGRENAPGQIKKASPVP